MSEARDHYERPDEVAATVFDPADPTFGPILGAIQAGDFERAARQLAALGAGATVTIAAEQIPEVVGYVSEGLRDEHEFRVRGDATRTGGLSPVEWAVLPALREHFTGHDRVMVDELLAWSESREDASFDAAMTRFMETVVKGRDCGWNVKAEGEGEWEVALWISGDYAGTWRLTAGSAALLDPEMSEVCQDCGKAIEPHASGCCDSCETARRYDEASR